MLLSGRRGQTQGPFLSLFQPLTSAEKGKWQSEQLHRPITSIRHRVVWTLSFSVHLPPSLVVFSIEGCNSECISELEPCHFSGTLTYYGHAACSCSQEEEHAEQTGSVEKKRERGGDVWKTMKKNGRSKRKKEAVLKPSQQPFRTMCHSENNWKCLWNYN